MACQSALPQCRRRYPFVLATSESDQALPCESFGSVAIGVEGHNVPGYLIDAEWLPRPQSCRDWARQRDKRREHPSLYLSTQPINMTAAVPLLRHRGSGCNEIFLACG